MLGKPHFFIIRRLNFPNLLQSCIQHFLTRIICFTDTSRHYLPIDVIKEVIESMSYAKLVSMLLATLSYACIYNWNLL